MRFFFLDEINRIYPQILIFFLKNRPGLQLQTRINTMDRHEEEGMGMGGEKESFVAHFIEETLRVCALTPRAAALLCCGPVGRLACSSLLCCGVAAVRGACSNATGLHHWLLIGDISHLSWHVSTGACI